MRSPVRAASIVLFLVALPSCRPRSDRTVATDARAVNTPDASREERRRHVDGGVAGKTSTARPSDGASECAFGALHEIAAHADAEHGIALAFVGGHLGATWIAGDGALAGTELRDDASILHPIGAADDSAARIPAGTRWARAYPILDTRSALVVDADRATSAELLCGQSNAPRAASRVAGAVSMIACRSVADDAPFTLAFGSVLERDGRPGNEIRVAAFRPAIAGAAPPAEPFADAAWVIPMAQSAASQPARPARDAADAMPRSIAVATVPGTGYVVAFVLAQRVYTGWMTARLAPASPLFRVADSTHADETDIAWNGREAVLLYTDDDGSNAHLIASRMAANRGPAGERSIVALASSAASLASPTIAALDNGESLVAWIESPRAGGDTTVRVQPLHADLTPREVPHGYGGAHFTSIRVASRRERVVLASIAGAGREGHVAVASVRCAVASGPVPASPGESRAEAIPARQP